MTSLTKSTSRKASAVAIMATFAVGVASILLGSVSEELKAGLGINNGKLGTLVTAFYLAGLVAVMLAGPLVDRFGYKPVFITGFAADTLGLILLAVANSYGLALVACAFLGIGMMCLNTSGNTLLPVVLFEGKEPARASNFGNGFFGLGYVLTPLLFPLVHMFGGNYRASVLVLAVVFACFLVISAVSKFPAASSGFSLKKALKVITQGPVIIAAAALFCYEALESSMSTWIKPYMTQAFKNAGNANAVSNAALVLSLFGVAMMIGRFASSAIKGLTAIGSKVIAGAALIAAIAIGVMVVNSTVGVAATMVFIAGLVFAPIYPTILGVTDAKFDPSYYGSIFAADFFFGMIGSLTIPGIIGKMSATGNQAVQSSLGIVAVIALILCVVGVVMGIVNKRYHSSEKKDSEEA
ncbi:MFS transporter [Bifidobacterium sp. ESL0732]|uniref:MFS transporter n=1 Tax=Bifidobacterium sp. ESL0732 TaxID=2983222 RepID=UPI0023F92DDB|nr:MFS transporter [Bifidobacterium sp. ESL0732]WEV64319.1 MFS transporter [Bifidobacterium sp. ESL0732]